MSAWLVLSRSQEKKLFPWPEVFLLRSPTDRARSAVTCRSICRLLGTIARRFGFSLPAVFIACLRRSLSVPKPAKQNVGQIGDHGSIWDSWPMALSGYPRGLGSGVRLSARGTQRLTNQLRLALEPECLENPMATTREDPQDGADSVSTIGAIFLAKVRRVISGLIPLATKAV
jgi:hypothetical protein